MVKSKFVHKSFLKNRETQTQTQTLFSKPPDIKGFRPNTETQKVSSARGGNCSPLFVLGRLTKGFRGFTQQKIRETIVQ